MGNQRAKPLWQLFLLFYFIPFLGFIGCSMLFSMQIRVALSIGCVSIVALLFFLSLKSWEFEWQKKILRLEKEKQHLPQVTPIPSATTPPPSNESLTLLKEKVEEVFQLTEENQTLKKEKQTVQKEKEEMYLQLAKAADEDKKELTKSIEKLQADLLERQLHTQMQESLITDLRMEIANLNFELRTLLKIEQKY